MYNRLVVPLDGSPLAEKALPHAIAQAERFGAEMILLRVVEPVIHVAGMSLRDLDRIRQRASALAEEYLQRVASDIRERGIPVQTRIVYGPAPVGIAQFAESNQADLVVMATGGRSGVRRWLKDSVDDRIVRRATAPVFLVRIWDEDFHTVFHS